MDIAQLHQVIGTHIPLQSHHTEPNSASDSSKGEAPKRPTSLKQENLIHHDEVDTNDPFIQMNTVSYLNNLLKFHKINLLAELSSSNGQTYISLSDGATGDFIKRLKIEDVISGMKNGDSSMVNLTI